MAYFLRGLMEMCIYPPRPIHASHMPAEKHHKKRCSNAACKPEHEKCERPDPHAPHQGQMDDDTRLHDSVPASASCTDDAIMFIIKQRDPTKQGLPNQAAVRLLLLLLHWNPANRPTAAEALRHAFFVLPLNSSLHSACIPNRSTVGWC